MFAEVDPDTYCIDVEDARRLITPRTVGLCAVHVFGLPAPIEPLQAARASAWAQAGVRRRARAGRALPRSGPGGLRRRLGVQLEWNQARDRRRGGLVTFRDPDAAERFSLLRAYGFKGDYNCRHIGLNGKLSELNAALGWLSLDLLRNCRDTAS